MGDAKKNISKLGNEKHCIVIDDASNDGAWEWISKEAIKRKNLTVSRNCKKLSLAFNIRNSLRFTNPSEKIIIRDKCKLVPN